MPIYEYLCQDCSYRFELKQSIKDDPIAACEKCGKSVGRIISAPAIMFKGSGWYITDYSDKMKPPAGESSSPASGEKKDTAAASPAAPAPAPAAAASTASTPAPSSGSGTSSAPSSAPASGKASNTGQ